MRLEWQPGMPSEENSSSRTSVFAQLTFLYCQPANHPDFCSRINGDASGVLPTAATGLFTATPLTSTEPSASSTSSTSTTTSSLSFVLQTSSRSFITSHSSTTSATIGATRGTAAASPLASGASSAKHRLYVVALSTSVPLAALLLLTVTLVLYCRSRRKRRSAHKPMHGAGWTGAEVPTQTIGIPYHSSRSSRPSDFDANVRSVSESSTRGLWRIYRSLFVDSTVLTQNSAYSRNQPELQAAGLDFRKSSILRSPHAVAKASGI